ncbi:hypothetical protein VNO77_19491 [Canavalia gladiata]|uniref:Uncharacterized protein n=1 Tax=Canavalia gladiata TaxID=3824 RepID=A0AAN9LRM4_CANGL
MNRRCLNQGVENYGPPHGMFGNIRNSQEDHILVYLLGNFVKSRVHDSPSLPCNDHTHDLYRPLRQGRRTGWVSLLVAVRKSLGEVMTVSHFRVNVTTCHHHYMSDLDEIIGAPKIRTGTLARADYEAQI